MSKERNKIIAANIKKYVKEKGITQKELANQIGISPSTMSDYMNLRSNPSHGVIQKIADYFGILKSDIDTTFKDINSNDISVLYNQLDKPRQQKVYNYAESLLEEQNKVVELPNRTAPLLGDVAANPTELAYGDPVYDEEVTSDVPSGADGALTIQGDSMEDLFRNGDICFFHRQPDVENGEIAIVEIDGTGVTCKKIIKENGSVILRSLNDKYNDRKIEKESVRIIGKVLV
ncbi:helix-turn-helix domain-containing protein [Marinilactibacillus psychrotolerans]|uniref:Helix-turn-helix domain-containing protein n=1 Tax=Marinilactibacillus psychrotolerans TaxID=191770 RepID=A0A5R9C2V8_9LACT|nr:XRE family transcriptional regulator [Marinilactibacillus psychrotolerans]TLQ07084.1 helix-turn-helix domain-containing protein [Marinilactibacillus psychrotolerans]